jgi:hypothetical protein
MSLSPLLVCLFVGLWSVPATSLARSSNTDRLGHGEQTQAMVMVAAAAGFRQPFDAVATARLRTGEMVEAIKASGQQAPATTTPDLIVPALLIQAGLRTLLLPSQRQGLALPGEPGPKDPKALIRAQNTLTEVVQAGRPANPQQRVEALQAITTGAEMLDHSGYKKAARVLQDWLHQNH